MGIDKSNVRWVIHNNLPKNVEGYYQEIGRAGRDGLKSEALLYFNYRDVKLLSDFARESEHSKVLLEKLNRMLEYAEATSCRRKVLLAYFSEVLTENCGNCDVCRNPSETFDGTIIAQKALSAIKRTDEKAGTLSVIELLRGAKTTEMFSKGYNTLKTFGIGADLSVQQWHFYLTQLKNLGLIEIAYDDNMHLKISSFGNDILFGKQQIELAKYKEKDQATETKVQKQQSKSLTPDELLFDRLKLLRRQIAVEDNVPAYVIFSDATLTEMASEQPVNSNEFLAIQGVGQQKLEKYGELFIDLIRQFKQDQRAKPSTSDETYQLYLKGLSLADIAASRNLAETTIYSHFAKLIQEKKHIDFYRFVSQEELDRIQAVLPNFDDFTQLKPIFEALEGEINYGKIRMAISFLDFNQIS